MLESPSAKEFKNRKLKSFFSQEIEPQEVFLDNLAQRKDADFGVSEKKFEVPLSRKILLGFFIFDVLLVLVLFSRTFQYQIMENEDFIAQAKKNTFIMKSLQASRGVIYDSKGEQIVFNKPSFNLIINKDGLPSSPEGREAVFLGIAQILGKDSSELKEKIASSKENLIIAAENIEESRVILLETKIDSFPGFEVQMDSKRDYKDSRIFSHIVGYAGQIGLEELKASSGVYSGFDYVGKEGLEKSYEEILRKVPGKAQAVRDAKGNLISKDVVSLPEAGKSLVLWLDSGLQRKIAEQMQISMERVGSKHGAAVAIDPKTGGILALVSIPGFDNNLFNKNSDPQVLKELFQDPEHSLYNRAVAATYPTGSTIKPLNAAAALEEKLVSPEKSFNCQGGITIPHRYDPEIVYEYNDWRIHGLTDMRKAIAESCNVYFYTIGGGYKEQKGLGPSRIKKYLELFGWGSKTGIDLPGESSGFIPSPEWKKSQKKESWFDGDTYNLSIGQGDIGVSPLQLAAAFTAIANGGTLFKPQLAKKVINGSFSSPDSVQELLPQIAREDFISPENLKVVREGMRQGVSGENSPFASSITLNSLPVAVAAKTGTAQTSKENYYHTWIAVFAPYDDPQIVLTIMIEDVYNLQAAVLPVAKEVLNWYFTR